MTDLNTLPDLSLEEVAAYVRETVIKSEREKAEKEGRFFDPNAEQVQDRVDLEVYGYMDECGLLDPPRSKAEQARIDKKVREWLRTKAIEIAKTQIG